MESWQSGRLRQTVNLFPLDTVVQIHHSPPNQGALVQLVRIPACHAGGHRFEPGTHRQITGYKL